MKKFKSLIMITAASIFYSLGISCFLEPNKIVAGGLSGLAIIANHLTNIPTGILMIAFNIPLFIFGIIKFGWKLLGLTIYMVIISSLMTVVFVNLGGITDNRLLASLTGSALLNAAVGYTFRAGATTGGSDILVKLLRIKYRHIKTGVIFMLIDVIVVLMSAFVFGDIDSALYSGIGIFVGSYVINFVLYGADNARMVYIISEKNQEILNKILYDLEIGATLIKGIGAYTGNQKEIIMCAVNNRALPKVREIAYIVDKEAFLIITKSTEIYGLGFKDNSLDIL